MEYIDIFFPYLQTLTKSMQSVHVSTAFFAACCFYVGKLQQGIHILRGLILFKINHEINILFVVLKFSARVDTYFLYNETLID